MSDHRPLNFDDLGYPTADTVRRADETERILEDLIAELVGMADQGLDSGWAPLYEVADRAEARLREVQGEW